MKRFVLAVSILFGLFVLPTHVSAHVVVRPAEVGVGAFQTFTISVPNEKDNTTVGVRLVIPKGLTSVTPTVKPGWTISTVTDGEEEEARITEISWTNGSIPVGQRDEFTFSARTPAEETNLTWKAYQTYESGETVAWDQDPNAEEGDGHDHTPFSQTRVINDLQTSEPEEAEAKGDSSSETALWLSIGALILSLAALGLHYRRR